MNRACKTWCRSVHNTENSKLHSKPSNRQHRRNALAFLRGKVEGYSDGIINKAAAHTYCPPDNQWFGDTYYDRGYREGYRLSRIPVGKEPINHENTPTSVQ